MGHGNSPGTLTPLSIPVVKCANCGVTSEFTEAFIQRRRSFRLSRKAWCPTCWSRKQTADFLRGFLVYLGIGFAGLLLELLFPSHWVGSFLMLLCLFYVFLILTIVPHELGHAWVARVLGWRVFKIVIGVGKTFARNRLGGFAFEWKPAPFGGITLVAPRQKERFRTKLFLLVSAGLVVNIVMGVAMFVFYPWSNGLPFHLDHLPAIPRFFLLANAWVLVVNLWPRTFTTLSVRTPSDGKQLLQAFFLKNATIADRHAAYFVMEAMESLERRNYHSAREWAETGLALYPDNFNLLNVHAVAALQENQLGKARETFLQLLRRDTTKGLQRYVILNNIAYVDALIGTPELLLEAEQCSAEAFRGIAWFPFMVGTRGTVLVQRGDLEQGIPLLEQSLRDSEETTGKAENACMLAIAESKRGQLDRAKNFLDLARQLNPTCYLIPRAEDALGAEHSSILAVRSESKI